MRKLNLKLIVVSAFILSSSQISAQESSSTNSDTDEPWENCRPWPSCALGVNSSTDEKEDASKWELFWEKLTKEMKEAVESLPAPTQPE